MSKIDYCNCRNCGAPKEFTKCNYCGTHSLEKPIKTLFVGDSTDAYKYAMLRVDGFILNNPNYSVIYKV
jgi:hypothetical protein